MRKKTEGKTEAQVALADFLFNNTNKTIDEAKSISDRFLEQIETKLQKNNLDTEFIFSALENVEYNQPVYLKQIPFISLCEHHLLPFFGLVDVAIFPSNKIAGVSKFTDLIDNLSSQLTLQEKLTEIIAVTINDLLECEGVFVRINAKHLCSDITNPKNSNFDIVTTYSTGLYKLDYSLRSEAILNFN